MPLMIIIRGLSNIVVFCNRLVLGYVKFTIIAWLECVNSSGYLWKFVIHILPGLWTNLIQNVTFLKVISLFHLADTPSIIILMDHTNDKNK